VVIADLMDTDGEALAASLGPQRARYVRANISVWKDMLNLFKTARAVFGNDRIDIVIANAGLMERRDFLEEALDDNGELAEPSYSVLDVNLKGCLNSKHALPFLIAANCVALPSRCIL
jgi:NAD(P)-dependent dehydrogenase (short-subunit alcohol dehydrogenase family)